MTLTGSGFAQTTWTVHIASGGDYVFTIGIFQATTQAGAPLLGAASITLVPLPDRSAVFSPAILGVSELLAAVLAFAFAVVHGASERV